MGGILRRSPLSYKNIAANAFNMPRSLVTYAFEGGSMVPRTDRRAEAEPDGSLPICCLQDPREETRRLFVDQLQKGRLAAGQMPALRPVFLKQHGIVCGRLSIASDLPDRYRHGIFAERQLVAWIRFSSDTAPSTPDSANPTLGIAIKVFGVSGATLDADDPMSGSADLLLQNHDRFFVDTGADFCAFVHAILATNSLDDYLKAHPETARVLDEMAKPEASVLATSYWSVVAHACGPATIVKYRLTPRVVPAPAQTADTGDPDRLRTDLAARLRAGEARFDLELQGFMSEEDTPIDRAMQRWSTPFVRIGSLIIDHQDIDTLGQSAYGENLSFDPWRVPEANRPLGSIADSRRVAYRSAAFVRRIANGVPVVEPSRPR